jgi:type I restriction enzyme M protein
MSKVPLRMFGQELQAESYAVSQMNTIIHDMDVEVRRGDTMINPKFRDTKGSLTGFDVVVSNPMWNQPFAPDLFKDDPFDRFVTSGGVTSGKGDWAWLQHTLASMSDHGRAAVVLDTGSMTRGSGSKNEDKERNIRQWFVDNDLIDGVILLPENLFYNTSAAGVIVVLNKKKPAARKGKIVMLNASKRFLKGRPKNYLPEEDIPDLAAMYAAGAAVEGELAVVSIEQVQAPQVDYNLSPNRYVGLAGKTEVRSVAVLRKALVELDKESRALTQTLDSLLAGVADNPAA